MKDRVLQTYQHRYGTRIMNDTVLLKDYFFGFIGFASTINDEAKK